MTFIVNNNYFTSVKEANKEAKNKKSKVYVKVNNNIFSLQSFV